METYIRYVELGCKMFTSNDIYEADRILRELHLGGDDIFYIPKGICYVSQWFGAEIEFYSFGFDIAPTDKSYILQNHLP